jgi:microcystin-dependent protein
MSDPFLGEIKMVGFNFAPQGWAQCLGQQMAIQQNSALFALLGVTFGGNGQTTFGLPDFRGRVPAGQGQGAGTSNILQGEMAGSPQVTLTSAQMPIHAHAAVFQGTPASGPVTLNIGTDSSTAIANPTTGGTSYLTATAVAVGRDPATITGLFTGTAPNAPAHLGGGSASVTPTGNVTVGQTGGSQPVGISQPYLGTNFIIALEGVFPSRG